MVINYNVSSGRNPGHIELLKMFGIPLYSRHCPLVVVSSSPMVDFEKGHVEI